jgi:hypothetical protein
MKQEWIRELLKVERKCKKVRMLRLRRMEDEEGGLLELIFTR